MRNVVAHHYGSISLKIVRNAVKRDVPILRAFCDELLSEHSHSRCDTEEVFELRRDISA